MDESEILIEDLHLHKLRKNNFFSNLVLESKVMGLES